MNDKVFWQYFEAASQNVDQATVFWNVTLHGLQNAFLMALSRLFDQGDDVHTVEKLVNHAVANPAIFSRVTFEARRIAENHGQRPAYLDDYLKGVWEPTVADLRDIARMARPHRKKFEANYKDIRDKTIAHSIAVDAADVSTLFSKTLIAEVEDIIYGLHDILEVVRQLYHNGRRPAERNANFDYKQRITDKTRSHLELLLKAWTTSYP
jgi:hypothetical protein